MNYNDLYFGGVPNSAYFTADLVEIFGIKKEEWNVDKDDSEIDMGGLFGKDDDYWFV